MKIDDMAHKCVEARYLDQGNSLWGIVNRKLDGVFYVSTGRVQLHLLLRSVIYTTI